MGKHGAHLPLMQRDHLFPIQEEMIRVSDLWDNNFANFARWDYPFPRSATYVWAHSQKIGHFS
jgi:hypothetical protein